MREKSDQLRPVDMSYHSQEESIETSINQMTVLPEENNISQDNDIPEGEELSTIIQEQDDSFLRGEIRETETSMMEIEGNTYQEKPVIEKRGDNNDNDNEEYSIDSEKKEFAKRVQQKNKKRTVFLKAMSNYKLRKAKDGIESELPFESNPVPRQIKKRNHNNFLKEVEVLNSRLRNKSSDGKYIETRKMSTRNNIQQITE